MAKSFFFLLISHLEVTSFYLSKNGHISISLVEIELSDGFLYQSVRESFLLCGLLRSLTEQTSASSPLLLDIY